MSRRQLFATVELRSVDNRAGLVALARTGYAGARLSGDHLMPSMPDRDLVALVALLRDARGVGLRVSWSGECGDLVVQHLQHLDPPRQPDGSFAWSPRPGGQLLARRGPTFISIDDTRHGARRRIVVDRSTPAGRVLGADDWGREIPTTQRASMESLTLDGLAFSVGDYCVGLPVRQGIWCA